MDSSRPLPPEALPEVMTIDQVARYLQLHKQVVYRHVRDGHIPVSRIGSTLRFKKSVIDRWLVDSALNSLRSPGNAPAPLPPTSFNAEVD